MNYSENKLDYISEVLEREQRSNPTLDLDLMEYFGGYLITQSPVEDPLTLLQLGFIIQRRSKLKSTSWCYFNLNKTIPAI